MRQILLYFFILFACSVSAEQVMIMGKVVDDHNEPLIGVSVQVKGTNRGTATDFDGNFSIVVEKGAILRFSYVGFYEKEVEILNNSSLFIGMRENGQRMPPVYIIDSLDFALPKSELKKLQKHYGFLSGEYVQLDKWSIASVKWFLDNEISDLCPLPFGQYAKQYICVRHGEDLVYFINFVSSKLLPKFKDRINKKLISVDDGGNNFGRAIVNYSTGEIIMLQWNGNYSCL